MVRTGTVKLSTLTALDGTPLNADHLLRVKERLEVRGAQETPDEVHEETAAMCYEAMDRVERAKDLRTRGKALMEEAAAEVAEAETLTNTSHQTIGRRMGL